MARQRAWASHDLINEAWLEVRDRLASAADGDAKAAVLRKFIAVFLAFASFNPDENMLLGEPIYGSANGRERKRAVLDRHPALAAWNVERDEAAKVLQARLDAAREAEAERQRAAFPSVLLARIREAGYDLTLDKQGRLLAAPGAVNVVDGGADALREHKDSLVVILKAEAEAAAAEAKRLAPILIG